MRSKVRMPATAPQSDKVKEHTVFLREVVDGWVGEFASIISRGI